MLYLREVYNYNMQREGIVFWEEGAELSVPHGTGQHLNLGQEGPWQQETLG